MMSHIDQVYLITSIESFQMTMELESVNIIKILRKKNHFSFKKHSNFQPILS